MTLVIPDPGLQTIYPYQGRTYIHDGIAWHLDSNNILNALQPAHQAELVYVLAAETDTIDLSTPDLNTNTFTLSTALPGEAVDVHLDGLKAVEGIDFTVDRALNSVDFPAALPVSTQVQISILTPRNAIAPGAVQVYKLLDFDIDWSDIGQPAGMVDGVATQFDPYYEDPVTTDPVAIVGAAAEAFEIFYAGVRQIPGDDYTVSSGTITFAQPPQPGFSFWGTFSTSATAGNGATPIASGTTAQRDAIVDPVPSVRYNTTSGVLEFYNGSIWVTIATV